MKKILLFLFVIFLFLLNSSLVVAQTSQETPKVEIPVQVCGTGSCPQELSDIYSARGEQCVTSVEDFEKDPYRSHLWVEDPEITAQGKSDERARQFLYWILNKPALDDHPVLKTIWGTTRNITYFFAIFIAAIIGIGFIVGQRVNFDLKIKIWPSIFKIAGALLYITFSASIVILLIQLSELLMKFFIENLGGRDLFNVYFGAISTEKNYLNFVGCRDLNPRAQEAVKSELFLLNATNITYYVMGVMLLLRKIVLWFMLFVSPFLAILLPFVFIRNIGIIWIGVFFQWLFYGPLFALFLGSISKIWKSGIPFAFDFSRVGGDKGYVFPTAINILYGGPSQTLGPLSNGNYVDTFAEYVITLIMLWAVIFFPWWLLRIFRDYCCDGIVAMKNILLSMYDRMGGTPPQPLPTPSLIPTATGTALKISKQAAIPIKVKLETLEEIKKAKTDEIVTSLQIAATKLTDLARFETDKEMRQTTMKNIDYLQNPMKAETPTQRQKYMNIRTELFNRAVKEDHLAKQVLSSISTNKMEQTEKRETIVKTIPQAGNISQVISVSVKVPQEKVSAVNSAVVDLLQKELSVINQVSQQSDVPSTTVQKVFTSLAEHINEPPTLILQHISDDVSLDKEKITTLIRNLKNTLKENKQIVDQITKSQNVKAEEIEKIFEIQTQLVTEPEKNIEKTVAIPPNISIEDYEAVRKMWQQHYEKGEVPVSENIQTREQWLEQDIVFMTNVLNKLLSSDDKLRQEGLDDLGYILPIFMINNLKGEELLVYLKAKLEAAKQVQDERQKEKEITEKLKAGEQFAEIAKPKAKEEEKTMEMKEELKEETK